MNLHLPEKGGEYGRDRFPGGAVEHHEQAEAVGVVGTIVVGHDHHVGVVVAGDRAVAVVVGELTHERSHHDLRVLPHRAEVAPLPFHARAQRARLHLGIAGLVDRREAGKLHEVGTGTGAGSFSASVVLARGVVGRGVLLVAKQVVVAAAGGNATQQPEQTCASSRSDRHAHPRTIADPRPARQCPSQHDGHGALARPMTPDIELERFIKRYDPEIAETGRQVLARMLTRVPGANVLVYDNYNALAMALAPTERSSDAVFPSRCTRSG